MRQDTASDEESNADSARCGIEDEELPPGVYRDKDGTVHDLDDGSYGIASCRGVILTYYTVYICHIYIAVRRHSLYR